MNRFEEMPWGDIRRLAHQGALFLVPVAPLEDHGPHLPAGVDVHLSEHFCRDLAAGLEERVPEVPTILLPPLAVGSSRLRSLGCLRVSSSTVRRVVLGLGRELALEGARRVAFVSAHLAAGHMAALERATWELRREGSLQAIAPAAVLSVRLLTGKLQARMEEALGRPLEELERQALHCDMHAGAIETSLMLSFRPDLVGGFYRELPPHRVTPEEMVRGLGRSLGTHRGYFGSPALASPELGRALRRAVVGEGIALLERFVRGEMDPGEAELGLRRMFWLGRDEARISGALWGLAAGLALGFALGRLLERPAGGSGAQRT